MFTKLAGRVSGWARQPLAFVIAVTLILLWILTGPVFGYFDIWQLAVNTAATMITSLIVFPIQNSQHRDAAAM